ncbi:MAG: hypothetical protein ACI38U_00620 [Corynebacterium sp.]|jgi:hypothetical protein|uniref:hypothetical protein n=1 Tax=unclassified Corynebacterium TaxID=2624378 RepID=UPI00096A4CBD|nr:hypothetical protein [Corynebacterium sp. CNJ-954]
MRSRRKTGVVGNAHTPDRDLDVNRFGPTTAKADSAGAEGAQGDGGFGEDFWEGERPPHW